jgi:hypothetical protein
VIFQQLAISSNDIGTNFLACRPNMIFLSDYQSILYCVY